MTGASEWMEAAGEKEPDMVAKSALVLAAILLATQIVSAQQPEKEKTRVYVADSRTWQVSGSSGTPEAPSSSVVVEHAGPQAAEIIKTVGEQCPDLIVTSRRDKSDFVLLIEGKQSFLHRINEVVVFNHSGDAVYSHSSNNLAHSVKEACTAIKQGVHVASNAH